MSRITAVYLVEPRRVSRHASVAAALARAARAERAAQATHGPHAGADCYVVLERGDRLEYRGMACGRRIVGQSFGCGPGVVARVAAELAQAVDLAVRS